MSWAQWLELLAAIGPGAGIVFVAAYLGARAAIRRAQGRRPPDKRR